MEKIGLGDIKTLFERLEHVGFLRGKKVDASKISHASMTEIIDVAEEFVQETSAEHLGRECSILTHAASLALGGGRFPCNSINCRLERVKRLAHFALLYSDRVYMNNLLDYFTHIHYPNSIDAERLRSFFLEDLTILSYLRPLFEEGIIVPFTPPNLCPQCLAKKSFGEDADKRLKNEHSRIQKELLEGITIDVEKRGNLYGFHFQGPEYFIEHGEGLRVVHNGEPDAVVLKKADRIMRSLNSGRTVHLPRATRKKLNFYEELADIIFNNIRFELASSQSLGTSFLTERPLDINILNSISTSTDIALEQRNQIAEKHLTSIVPYLDEIALKDVIKIRQREPEAFILYRGALNRAIEEFRKQGTGLTKRTAQAIYGDIIASELAKLDRKVRIAKKDLIKGTFRKTVAWAGAISFGIYAGFVPTDLIGVASALGLAQVAAELLEMVMHKSDSEQSIRSEEMYFLWKVLTVTKKS